MYLDNNENVFIVAFEAIEIFLLHINHYSVLV